MKKTSILLLSFLCVGAVDAQERQGIAFVEAPEQSAGMCFSDNADKGFACAKSKCSENGTDKSDCLRVKWCYPAGWSADIFMQHKDGPHWHQYLCGWQSKTDLQAAAKIACEGSSKEWLLECAIVGVWGPDGKEALNIDN